MVRVIRDEQLSVPVQCQTDPDCQNAVWIYGDSTYTIQFKTLLVNSAGVEGTMLSQSFSGENISHDNEINDGHNSQVHRCVVCQLGNSGLLISVLLAILALNTAILVMIL